MGRWVLMTCGGLSSLTIAAPAIVEGSSAKKMNRPLDISILSRSWRERVQAEVATRGQRLSRVWSAVEQADRAAALRPDLESLLVEIISAVLVKLYPDSIRPGADGRDERR